MTILNLTYYENKAFLKQCTSSSFKVHFYFLGSVHSSSSWRVQLISLLYLHQRYYYKGIPDLLISLTNDHFIIHGHDWGVLITSLADAFITVTHDVNAWLHTHLARSLNSIWRIFKNVVWDTNVMHYYFIKRAQYKSHTQVDKMFPDSFRGNGMENATWLTRGSLCDIYTNTQAGNPRSW